MWFSLGFGYSLSAQVWFSEVPRVVVAHAVDGLSGTLEINKKNLAMGFGGEGGRALLQQKATLVESLGRNKEEGCDTIYM